MFLLRFAFRNPRTRGVFLVWYYHWLTDLLTKTLQEFNGVVFTPSEGARLAAALGPKGKGLILRNHGLLTVGGTVDEACYLYTLMERSCQVQLLAEAAAATGLPKVYVPDEAARYTFEAASDPEALYWEAQPDMEWEAEMGGGRHAE